MATLKQRLHRKNSSGTYDVIHLETSADLITGILAIENGGTGNSTGLAAKATILATARTIQTNLGSTSSASFNGSANITPGVTGTLPVARGGTGQTSNSPAVTTTAYRAIYAGTSDMTAGSTSLTTGVIYLQYE